MICTITIDVALIGSGATYAAAMVPALLLVIYMVQHFYLRTSRQLRILELEAKAPLISTITETSNGIQHIRAFQWQGAYMENMQQLINYSQIPAYIFLCVQRWLILVLDLCVCGVATLLVAMAVKFPDKTNENALGLAMLSIVTFSETLVLFVESFAGLELALGAVARVRNFCRDTPTEEEKDVEQVHAVPDNWPATGDIEFRDVSASYT